MYAIDTDKVQLNISLCAVVVFNSKRSDFVSEKIEVFSSRLRALLWVFEVKFPPLSFIITMRGVNSKNGFSGQVNSTQQHCNGYKFIFDHFLIFRTTRCFSSKVLLGLPVARIAVSYFFLP